MHHGIKSFSKVIFVRVCSRNYKINLATRATKALFVYSSSSEKNASLLQWQNSTETAALTLLYERRTKMYLSPFEIDEWGLWRCFFPYHVVLRAKIYLAINGTDKGLFNRMLWFFFWFFFCFHLWTAHKMLTSRPSASDERAQNTIRIDFLP